MNIRKMNKIYLLLSAILMLSFVSATITQLGSPDKPYPLGSSVRLPQLCSTCSYNNITSILYPDSTKAIGETAMTKSGTEYFYTLSGSYTSTQSGTYTVNGHGDINGVDTNWNYTFVVGGTPVYFYILIIAVSWFAGAFGFLNKNGWISVGGGMLMLAASAYILATGISVYNDLGTQIVGFATFAFGAIFAFYPLYEEFRN